MSANPNRYAGNGRPITCPARCGSMSFRAIRRGAVTEEFTVDSETGEIIPGDRMAEAGGRIDISCTECGRHWRSRRDDVSGLARYVEEPA